MTASAHGAEAIRLTAPAKINLRLCVLAREASGFHQIETLFCALELADIVEVRHANPGFELRVSGAQLGPPTQNLAYRAAQLFFRTSGIDPHVAIALHKRIPVGGGLGGGSSDAATTLRALDALCAEPLGEARLLDLAPALGSDVPFFLVGSPLALAWGHGERLLPLRHLPAAPVLLAVPPFPSSTAEAYGELAKQRSRAKPHLRAARLHPDRLGDWTDIATVATNDFEPVLFARFPELAAIKSALVDAGANVALLAGSGSTVFGVFPDDAMRDAAAENLQDRFPDLHLVRTHTATEISAATDTASPGPPGPAEG